MPDYKVKFEVFEGPLDLLLYLIKKEEVDIYQINLTQIATQFIEYIEVMRMLDLEIAGEFLVMAATLMYIKSRELLPVDKQITVNEDEEEGEDPRWELIRQLVEYKKFKDAAGQLAQLETKQEAVFPRIPGIIKFEAEPEDPRPQASIFDLVNAVNAILKRHESPRNEEREIYEERWTVSEKIEVLLKTIAEKPVLKFSELFADAQTRGEVVVTFLAMLELIRLHHLMAVQTEAFGEIELTRPPASTEQVVATAEEGVAVQTNPEHPSESDAQEDASGLAEAEEHEHDPETSHALTNSSRLNPEASKEETNEEEANAESAVEVEAETEGDEDDTDDDDDDEVEDEYDEEDDDDDDEDEDEEEDEGGDVEEVSGSVEGESRDEVKEEKGSGDDERQERSE